MLDVLMQGPAPLLAVGVMDILAAVWPWVLIVLGFSAVIFVHEFGHYVLAKWAGVRVEKFCIGFGRELFGFTRGETRYGFNLLPLGGYVKMLGQEDFEVDATGELQHKDDPRSFANKPVGHRMAIVSGGVIMNVVFAAFLFMIVFMVGLEVVVPQIGFVMPNSPADLGGLKVGDTVLEINGREIKDFQELNMAIMLADPHEPLQFDVQRGGQVKHLSLRPENAEERGVLMVGVGSARTRRVVASPPGADTERPEAPRRGDLIVEIDGQEVNDENANEMFHSLVDDPGRMPEVIVERPADPDHQDSPTTRVRVEVQPLLSLSPSDPTSKDLINVLGLAPLMRFDFVEPGGRAEKAGIKVGDTVVRIGGIDYPTQTQIARVIRENCTQRTGPGEADFDFVETDIPISVQRRGEAEPLAFTIRPRVRDHLFKRNSFPDIEGSFNLIADDVAQVGQLVADLDGIPSPAAEANIPPGALIQRVAETEVHGWIELTEQLRLHAGQTVAIGFTDAEGTPGQAQMRIPHCLRSRLGLPITSDILSVDGADVIEVDWKGQPRKIRISHWYGLKRKLTECVGRTVEVQYVSGHFGPVETARVEITADMIDPWMGRITYQPNIVTDLGAVLRRTSNPIEAVAIGVNKTAYFILNVYATMKRMIFTRSVGVEQLSGPVGIVKLGSDMASAGLTRLLYFLAIISANLAVINFLPLPIVDGGLMVFLILEKIKGTPVSIRTQVVTQVVGLVLIIAMFLFVTYQDLQRLFG